MMIASNLPENTPQEIRDLIEQLEKDRDTAKAELEALKNPPSGPQGGPKVDVRTLPPKEYERQKAEAIRSLARARLRNPITPPEAKDVRTMTKAEYEQFKRQTLKK